VRVGVRMRVLRSGDAAIVTWVRGGHAWILAVRGVHPEVLRKLAHGGPGEELASQSSG
jgi:hypothetical protein